MSAQAWANHGKRAAVVHRIHRRSHDADANEICIALKLDNYPHILSAYGRAAANEVVDEIKRRIYTALRGEAVVAKECGGRLYLVTWRQSDGGFAQPEMTAESLLATLSRQRVQVGGKCMHAELTAACIRIREGVPDADREAVEAVGEMLDRSTPASLPPCSQENWAAGYADDMARTAEVFAAIADDRLPMSWQPVRDGFSLSRVLHYECLYRLIDRDGTLKKPGSFIPSLEATGLIRAFDRFALRRAIQELEADPSLNLAVRVSARSTVLDCWWAVTLALLERHPSTARRLVIEITGGMPLRDNEEVVAFVKMLQALGCCVAFDDFGMSFDSVQQILKYRPDLVKIDHSVLRSARKSAHGAACLHHMVELAETNGARVVVKGVADGDDRHTAIQAGARWLQGYCVGAPSNSRRAFPPSVIGKGDRPVGVGPQMGARLSAPAVSPPASKA